MNKYLFLFYSLTLISFSLSDEFDLYNMIESYYGFFPRVVEGYENANGKCHDIISKEKTKILEIIKGVLDKVKEGVDFMQAFMSSMGKLYSIEGFMTHCNILLELTSKMNGLISSSDKIADLGFTLIKRARIVYNNISELQNTKDLKSTGKILRSILKDNI